MIFLSAPSKHLTQMIIYFCFYHLLQCGAFKIYYQYFAIIQGLLGWAHHPFEYLFQFGFRLCTLEDFGIEDQ